MPNRIIKESINESYGLSECSFFACDLYKRLITYADDYGRFNSDTAILRARLYPREYDSVTEQDVVDGLIELVGVGKIAFYTAKIFNQGGKPGIYGVFPNWATHQRIRDSKTKCPEPHDDSVNDWYLRRFVSLDMKARILERDGFKCKICGKFLTSCRDARRFVKLGQGLFHIDHIVPCQQGGRATMENLQLTCPECNLKRKKWFSFREVVEFAENGFAADCGDSRQLAADCGDSRPKSNPNPIQSESESKSEDSAEQTRCVSSAPPAITLPLNDGTEYPITEEQCQEWAGLYPAVDVIQQLRAMRGWLTANPKKRKTKSGILRFVNGWLSKEQNRARAGAPSQPAESQQRMRQLKPRADDAVPPPAEFAAALREVEKKGNRAALDERQAAERRAAALRALEGEST